jgi:adenylate cyclase
MSETRKLAAILVSDVVGYSRLAGADEDRILARLRTLRSDLIDPTIAVHHGRIVKRTGDGSIIEFRSVVDAVNCANEVQRAMVERNAEVAPDKRIEFRIGIHLGEWSRRATATSWATASISPHGSKESPNPEGFASPTTHIAGQVPTRPEGHRSRPGTAEEHRRAYARLLVRCWCSGAGETGGTRDASSSHAAEKAFRARAARRALAMLLVVVAGGAWWFLNANRAAGIAAKMPAEAARLSIVVLPFANLSGDPGQDYLVDALTDELTTSLARMRDTFVIARNTAMTFKGKPVDAKAIGKELGVRYVLEGSVQPSGDRMRVNAQLIEAGSGAHLWAQQFDTPRADLLQTQDAIVAHLANTLDLQLQQAYVEGVKRTPAASSDAEDLALQCSEGQWKAGYIGKEADAAYSLCEQALAIDPNNVRALMALGVKFYLPASIGFSSDPKGDLERADQLESKALALDPNWTWPHEAKGNILRAQGRAAEAVAEHERALALDPSNVTAAGDLGFDYERLGEFNKSIEYFDKAIRASPSDPSLAFWYGSKTSSTFALKRYDEAIELARRTIAINPNYLPWAYTYLVAALALTGHDTEAREVLQRYLLLPSAGPLKTVAAWKALTEAQNGDQRFVEAHERMYDRLRKAAMPEELITAACGSGCDARRLSTGWSIRA